LVHINELQTAKTSIALEDVKDWHATQGIGTWSFPMMMAITTGLEFQLRLKIIIDFVN
jgi:hypothetical protein